MEVDPPDKPQFDAIQEAEEAGDSGQEKTLYRVSTWDAEWEEFAPQQGIPSIVQGIAGLRQAIRELRLLGYAACRGDSAVLIERLDSSSSSS